jgi:putative phage-type endonuclease
MEETALDLMREYCQDNLDTMHKDSFSIEMIQEVRAVLESQFETVDETVLIKALVMLPCGRTSYHCPPMNNIAERIEKIRSKPQPAQRTPEWYEYRRTLLTASVAYKALGTPAKQRELIKRREAPIVTHDHVCTEGPMHWGVKYEPVSVHYYQWKYNTIIEEFGCITHDVHTLLGASPDGINVSPGPLYGRMLEIKNPFTRDITGIPKEEYWVQCQVQMEVCDLDACDFLETKFVEYESEEAFRADGTFQTTADGKLKGIYLQFLTDTVVYEYAPFQCTEEEYIAWERNQMDGRSWIKTAYWKLDDVSCVLIRRQPDWFALMVNKFTATI